MKNESRLCKNAYNMRQFKLKIHTKKKQKANKIFLQKHPYSCKDIEKFLKDIQ